MSAQEESDTLLLKAVACILESQSVTLKVLNALLAEISYLREEINEIKRSKKVVIGGEVKTYPIGQFTGAAPPKHPTDIHCEKNGTFSQG